MLKIAKCIAAIFAVMAVCVPATLAGTYTAATCNYVDVNAVINGPTHAAVPGDTIIIPSGSCTWANALNISVGITLIGSGTPNSTPNTFGAGTLNTTILSSKTGGLINVTVPAGQTMRISTLLIEPASPTTSLSSPISVAGACNSSGCPQLRIDNVNFTGWSESGNGNGAAWMIRTDNMVGVIDHVTIPQGSGADTLLGNVKD